jgi:hypothetical protein
VDGFGHCLSSKMPESTRTHLAWLTSKW